MLDFMYFVVWKISLKHFHEFHKFVSHHRRYQAPYPVPGRKDEDGSSYEIDFLVHQSQVGGIIGKAGFKIKQIREVSILTR